MAPGVEMGAVDLRAADVRTGQNKRTKFMQLLTQPVFVGRLVLEVLAAEVRQQRLQAV